MKRYYFNLCSEAGRHKAPDGDDYPDLDAARLDAVISAKEMIADALRAGDALNDALRHSIEATDESGTTVFTLSFSEAVQINTRKQSASPFAA